LLLSCARPPPECPGGAAWPPQSGPAAWTCPRRWDPRCPGARPGRSARAAAGGGDVEGLGWLGGQQDLWENAAAAVKSRTSCLPPSPTPPCAATHRRAQQGPTLNVKPRTSCLPPPPLSLAQPPTGAPSRDRTHLEREVAHQLPARGRGVAQAVQADGLVALAHHAGHAQVKLQVGLGHVARALRQLRSRREGGGAGARRRSVGRNGQGVGG